MNKCQYTVTRYHDFCAGHRVYGHEGKCAHIHGHNYRVHFTVAPETVGGLDLDSVGRVLDFDVIKRRLCQWLEDEWDHKFLVWEHDPLASTLTSVDIDGTVVVPFNPTAENMGAYLIEVIGPKVLRGTGTHLVKVVVEETRKCSVEVRRV